MRKISKGVDYLKITIRNDHVIIQGYVNAVGRDSKPIITEHGKCVEQIEPQAFSKALSRNKNITMLLNHDSERCLGSTGGSAGGSAKPNVQLREDSIGLRATATIYDADIIKKARNNELRGWSFGMHVNKDKLEKRKGDIPRRIVQDLDLLEVSILDNRRSPAYAGTSIEMRDETSYIYEQRVYETEVEMEVEADVEADDKSGDKADEIQQDKPIDYSGLESRIRLHRRAVS